MSGREFKLVDFTILTDFPQIWYGEDDQDEDSYFNEDEPKQSKKINHNLLFKCSESMKEEKLLLCLLQILTHSFI
jgi:hypothetical protein